jgi:hypothetical protein
MFETCVLCGDTIPEGTQVCHKCVREIEKKHMCVRRTCKHWNGNGLFCELTGLDCIGLSCHSFDNKDRRSNNE